LATVPIDEMLLPECYVSARSRIQHDGTTARSGASEIDQRAKEGTRTRQNMSSERQFANQRTNEAKCMSATMCRGGQQQAVEFGHAVRRTGDSAGDRTELHAQELDLLLSADGLLMSYRQTELVERRQRNSCHAEALGSGWGDDEDVVAVANVNNATLG